jgi:hypothetical protein
VVGEEVDVACRLVEVVGAEALVELGGEDLLAFVELHDDLHDATRVDPVRVERRTHPLLAGLRGHDPPSTLGSLVMFHTLIGREETLVLAPLESPALRPCFLRLFAEVSGRAVFRSVPMKSVRPQGPYIKLLIRRKYGRALA